MANVANNVLDSGLAWVDTNGSSGRIDILSQEATTYTQATSTYTLGYEDGAPVAIAAPADRSGGGRQVTVSAISAGDVTGTGTATHWALTDGTSTFICCGDLASSQGVTSGNTFSLTSFEIGIPDPA